jgi:hypothetical protein
MRCPSDLLLVGSLPADSTGLPSAPPRLKAPCPAPLGREQRQVRLALAAQHGEVDLDPGDAA